MKEMHLHLLSNSGFSILIMVLFTAYQVSEFSLYDKKNSDKNTLSQKPVFITSKEYKIIEFGIGQPVVVDANYQRESFLKTNQGLRHLAEIISSNEERSRPMVPT